MARSNLCAQLLGGARVRLGSGRVTFAPEKRYQLLAYLAYAGDWVGRERLCYLFWPDSEAEKAQQNLRGLLRRVRRLEWLVGFEANNHALRWRLETDAAAFRRALQEDRLDEALSLYGGPLLAGLETDQSPEFLTWLEYERARLHSLWREALLKRAQSLRGTPAETARLLEGLLEADPLDEEALQAYMTATHGAGQRQRALLAYHQFSRMLQNELGLEPTTATQALAQRLEQETMLVEQVPKAARAGSPSTLPTPVTSFVGRDLELAEIAHLLAKPDCRLLTLLGSGGIGKTRLALRAAEELGVHYPDGVHFVPLEALLSPDAIPFNLARALGLALQGQGEPLAQVVHYLEGKHLLLVLDNFEHLLGGATLASHLLQHCPKLKLLVTSRERLNLFEEWLLNIEGLPLPADDHEPLSDAVVLFTERAQQVLSTFAVTDETLPPIVQICRLVQGSPLGIELAAPWVRLMSVADIAREIEMNLDLLSTPARNVPERQRSIRATFEHSWKFLSVAEQEALSRLSVFRGGFTREAAAVVAGVPVAVLAALLDKSLVQVTQGRYDRHPLLYQYTQEKLAEHPEEEAQMRERHGGYYVTFLVRQGEELYSPKQKQALATVEEELENVRGAWRWLSSQVRAGDLLRACDAMQLIFDIRGRYKEAVELLDQAVAGLDEANPAHYEALGTVLIYRAWFYLRLGRHEDCHRTAERGLALASLPKTPVAVLLGYNALAAAAYSLGDFAEAKRHRETLAGLIYEVEEKGYLPSNLTTSALAANTANTGDVETALGNYAEARRCYERALALHRGLGTPVREADNLNDLGYVLLLMGEPEEALPYMQEGLKLAREVGMQRVIPIALRNLAATHLELGDYAEALAHGNEALRVAREGEVPSAELEALLVLGRICTELGEGVQAESHLSQGLKIAWTIGETPKVLSALVCFGELRLRQGRKEKAASLLSLAARHPKTEHAARKQAEQALGDLLDELAPKGRAGLEQNARTLEEVVAETLKE